MATVLVVEDEVQIRVLAEEIIQQLGHDTLTAGTKEEALALLQAESQIDVLFTDLNLLEDRNAGLEVAKAAREARPNIRVLYTTGGGVNDGTRALFRGGMGVRGKPYTIPHLTTALTNTLGNSQR
jgi:CheY-like chemotaxis protein